MKKKEAATPEGIRYEYFKCESCGEEIVDMTQLHAMANKYKALKIYHAKMTRWGQSLGFRIPKALVIKYHFTPDEEVTVIPEKDGIKIIPA